MKRKQAFSFARILLTWNRKNNNRKMPWKGEKDPYKIWLSEIILQQTRVEQGLKYYQHFTTAFPDIHKLANAPDEKIYKHWEGLGYYTRCRNLITTARYISGDLKGKFPDNYEEIKKLKGVGPYTAAAIASFAFDLPHAVLDGNVFRVLARIYGIDKPIDSTEGKIFFTRLANELLDRQLPGLYNQAIMDFGAVICKPRPACRQCPFKKYCSAFLTNKIDILPVKSKKTSIRKRWFYYILAVQKDKFAIHQRLKKDIWHNLFEFPLIESGKELNQKQILKEAERMGFIEKKFYEVRSVSPVLSQRLSHQLIKGQFIKLKLGRRPRKLQDILWVSQEEVKKYAFPKFINQYMQKNQDMRDYPGVFPGKNGRKKIHISV